MKRKRERCHEEVLKRSTETVEERKRHSTFKLSSLIEAVCGYQMLHVDLNPFEILEKCRCVRKRERGNIR